MDYPYGSARLYAASTGPSWLDRGPVEEFVCAARRIESYDPGQYASVFPSRLSGSERAWIEARVAHGDRGPDALPNLVEAAPAAVQGWLAARSLLADGTRAGCPLVDVDALYAAVAGAPERAIPWRFGDPRRPRDGWEVLTIGLLRALCGNSIQEIAARVARPCTTVRAILDAHDEMMRQDPLYGMRAREAAMRSLAPFRAGVEVAARVPRLRDLLKAGESLASRNWVA